MSRGHFQECSHDSVLRLSWQLTPWSGRWEKNTFAFLFHFGKQARDSETAGLGQHHPSATGLTQKSVAKCFQCEEMWAPSSQPGAGAAPRPWPAGAIRKELALDTELDVVCISSAVHTGQKHFFF